MTVRIRPSSNPAIHVRHSRTRTTLSILTPDACVVIQGEPVEVERFIVMLLAEYQRPIVKAQVEALAALAGAESCPCGGKGACCNAAWNDEP